MGIYLSLNTMRNYITPKTYFCSTSCLLTYLEGETLLCIS
ncbi:MAG: hypothetical protein UX25_C0046G0006 [Candidatus Woesebacteria bacterium GW2011_GWC2_45_9]|uniref:Uncharacterized protein n=1 Tax=Candidatus Woesebacteria bacterium GW2011_GWC2_45_9 TaxID=1618589 RepID=A0A0G1N6U8_9BACT|nr:MAG: hypothetical protein UX25_C0046G0006 [Candidatus Woesebacteria bacterium GW2011_GWC2_45_9]